MVATKAGQVGLVDFAPRRSTASARGPPFGPDRTSTAGTSGFLHDAGLATPASPGHYQDPPEQKIGIDSWPLQTVQLQKRSAIARRRS